MAGSKVSSGLCPPFLLTALLCDPPLPQLRLAPPMPQTWVHLPLTPSLGRGLAPPALVLTRLSVASAARLKPWLWVHTVTQRRAARVGAGLASRTELPGCDLGPGLPRSCPCPLLSPSRDGGTFPGAHPWAKGQQDTSSTLFVSGTRRLALPHQAECQGGGRWPNPEEPQAVHPGLPHWAGRVPRPQPAHLPAGCSLPRSLPAGGHSPTEL